MRTTYSRRFTFNASHLSDEGYKWLEADNGLQTPEGRIECLLQMLKNTHGHTFTVELDIGYDHQISFEGWAVDDYRLRAVISEWDDVNLTFHPDFAECRYVVHNGRRQVRATTENITAILSQKLWWGVPLQTLPQATLKVRVFETPDVYATVELKA